MSVVTDTKPIDEGYVLQRNKTETQRLDKQNYLFVDMMGYHIHPSVEQKLGPNACIADVGTGTAIWLRDLVQKYPSTVQLHGFDVSSAQYPDSSLLSANLTLHEHNAKNSFPVEYDNKFDVVQARFIAGGLKDGDWTTVTNNILRILKPGGAIQWIEPDYYPPLSTNIDGAPAIAHQLIWQKMIGVSGLSAQAELGAKVLPQVFLDAGMTDIAHDICFPRSQQKRDEWSRNLIDVGFQIVEGLGKKGFPGAPTIEELQKWREDAYEEFQRGARYSMPVHVTVGLKQN